MCRKCNNISNHVQNVVQYGNKPHKADLFVKQKEVINYDLAHELLHKKVIEKKHKTLSIKIA